MMLELQRSKISNQSMHTECIREGLQPEILDPDMEKKIWFKLDLYMLPVITMMYFLSFLDRSNIGNARIAGLQADLKMTNEQFSIALTITNISFMAVELPSNLLLKRVGPDVMLPTMLTLWGVLTAMQGFVQNYSGLLACRFLLGFLEGGVLPGMVLYLSCFYPRLYLNWRLSIVFSAVSLSGAFSGLLAFGIVHLNGIGNKRGWEWIFILEGLFTVLCGIASFRLLPRSPLQARFLSGKEKNYLLNRLERDGATSKDDSTDSISWREVGMAFTLPQVWMLAILFFLSGTVLNGLAYFTPSIVEGLGYTVVYSQLMSVPPFALAFVLTMTFAYVSDRYQCRGLVSLFSTLLSIIGFSIFLESDHQKIRYLSLFFSIPGTYIAGPALATWNANNVTPHIRRATAIAIGFIMTSVGGIFSVWLFGSLSRGPRFLLATNVLLSFSVLMVVFTAFNMLYLWRQNKYKTEVRRGLSPQQEKPGLGDKSAWFIYTL